MSIFKGGLWRWILVFCTFLLLYVTLKKPANWISETTFIGSSSADCKQTNLSAKNASDSETQLEESEPIRKAGFCFPVIWDTWPLLISGRFPQTLLWRPLAALFLISSVALITLAIHKSSRLKTLQFAHRLSWRSWWALAAMALTFFFVSITGFSGTTSGIWTYVPIENLGGVLLTIFAASFCIFFAFPVGVVAAALTHSSFLSSVRWIIIGICDVLRGLPLITLLLAGHYILPLAFSSWFSGESTVLLRALCVLVLFGSAYFCEVLRGGMSAVGLGQAEASFSLGLSPLNCLYYIIMPQALKATKPALVGTMIGLLKDVSLLSALSLHEVLSIARTIPSSSTWAGFDLEPLVFACSFYVLICYSAAQLAPADNTQNSSKSHNV